MIDSQLIQIFKLIFILFNKNNLKGTDIFHRYETIKNENIKPIKKFEVQD